MKKKLLFALLSLLLLPLGVIAQNVAIDLVHGSLLAAMTDNGETGSSQGFKALWRHEQLALSMTGTDRDGLTETGEVLRPSAVFGERNGKIFISGGRRPSFIVVSLPKGYRITGYTLVLVNDLVGDNSNVGTDGFANINSRNGFVSQVGETEPTMRFYETKPWETDKTNAGTIEDRGSGYDGYTDNQVRYLALGTGWDYVNQNPQSGGTIGTASTDILATATAADDDTDINPSDAGKKYTISRTSTDANPMGNQIYFRLVKDYYYYGLTIESFEIRFTAEGTFEVPVKPSESSTTAVSMDASPFKTNKIDIGEMSMNEQPGNESNTQFSYKWGNVTDLDAYNYIYQDDAHENNADLGGEVPADVATTKNIYKVSYGGDYWYGLKSDVYFVEPPIEVENKAHNMVPIGYRIVGAKINYALGEKVTGSAASTETFHYITYESGGTTYYLNTSGVFGTEPVTWEVDENNNIHNGSTYLTYDNNRNLSTGNQSSNNKALLEAETTNNTDTRRLYITDGGTRYLNGATSGAPRFRGSADDYAYWKTETVNHPAVLAYDPEPYQIQLYDRTGTKIEGDNGVIVVDEDNPSGSKDLGLLNNDAIKFEILRKNDQGQVVAFSQNGMALVTVTLYLQALDPYIDKMDIVCHDDRNVLQLTQTFTADNFSVAGDRFIFYVPEDYGHEDLTFTFSGLYSKYGDETYYDRGEGSARYSFVASEYFLNRIDGNENKGLYQTDVYDPNHPYNGYPVIVEGVEGRSLSKIETSTAGKYRFKFNNAQELAVTQPGETTTGYLTEYPFSVKTYLNTENPGDPTAYYPVAASTDKGEFIECVLNASKSNQKSGTYYVFTADETRWNIAPTDGWQHRFYAFYRMEIELEAKTFEPELTWKKIYDKTFYNDGTEDKEDSMWGLTLDVANEDGQKVTGYLTYQEILDHIQGREGVKYNDQAECDAVNAKLPGAIAAGNNLTQDQADAVNRALGTSYQAGQEITSELASTYNATLPDHVTTDDFKIKPIKKTLKDDNSTAPASMKQLLYIDGTPLYAMLNSSQNSVFKYLEDLKAELNPNALVFLPENTTSTLDNVAYETSSTSSTNILQAGKNIVLTDKIPFYTPYDIQVDAANYATHTRKITVKANEKVVNATVMLPFTLTVDNNGKHTNPSGGGKGSGLSFTVNQLGSKEIIAKEGKINYGTAYFEPVSSTTSMTEANTPYMINVADDDSQSFDTDVSFIATQKGSLIVKTPVTSLDQVNGTAQAQVQTEAGPKPNGYGYSFTGELIKGKVTEGVSFGDASHTVNFTNYASYSGNKFKHTANSDIFYFTKNEYVNMNELVSYLDLCVYPFRGIYAYTSPNGNSREFKLKRFDVSYEKPEGDVTAIDDAWKSKADLMIRSDKGSMTLTATRAQEVTIYSASGICVAKVNMQGGDTQTVNIPSGVYVVNNVKIAVK